MGTHSNHVFFHHFLQVILCQFSLILFITFPITFPAIIPVDFLIDIFLQGLVYLACDITNEICS